MADPLSVIASVVGITTAVLQSVQFLAKTIGDIKDVPDTIKSIRADLQAVEPVLRNLNKALQAKNANYNSLCRINNFLLQAKIGITSLAQNNDILRTDQPTRRQSPGGPYKKAWISRRTPRPLHVKRCIRHVQDFASG